MRAMRVEHAATRLALHASQLSLAGANLLSVDTTNQPVMDPQQMFADLLSIQPPPSPPPRQLNATLTAHHNP